MKDKCVIEFLFTNKLASLKNQVSEFLRMIGFYVYETSMSYAGWQKKSKKAGITKKIFLVEKESELSQLTEFDSKETIYVISEKPCKNYDLLGMRYSIEEVTDLLIPLVGKENESIIRQLYTFYSSKSLYQYLYIAKNNFKDMNLLAKTSKELQQTIEFIESLKKEQSSSFLNFSEAYLCLFVNLISDRLNKEKPYNFHTVIDLCNSYASTRSNAFYELKGDIFLNLSDQTIFSLMAYREYCLNSYNYTVPMKLAKMDFISNTEEKKAHYYSLAYQANEEFYEAGIKLAKYYFHRQEKEKALSLCSVIVEGLKEKEKTNYLSESEFYSSCSAHHLLGNIFYQDKDNLNYRKALAEFKKVLLLWNSCEKNPLIWEFDEPYQKAVCDHYKDSFNIRGVFASLSKVYKCLGDSGKERECFQLFLSKTEDLNEVVEKLILKIKE